MAATVSDFVVSRLHEWGVKRLYGYSGDGINGVMAALRRADGNPRLIQPRHEEVAAFMACAHAKFSDEVGVCVATSGPGAVHLLNGLYDARKDHMPVVAIVGGPPRSDQRLHRRGHSPPAATHRAQTGQELSELDPAG